MKRVIVYIDGYNLYFGMKSARKKSGWPNTNWLDVEELAKKLVGSQRLLIGIKYFTARIKSPGSAQRQAQYLEALATLKLVQIIEGEYQLGVGSCRHCQASWPVSKEKMTDVNIAVNLVVDAYENSFDEAFVLSGDSDLVPPIKAVRKVGKQVIVVFPPHRTTNALLKVSDGKRKVQRNLVEACLLPDEVFKSPGVIIKKPVKWS